MARIKEHASIHLGSHGLKPLEQIKTLQVNIKEDLTNGKNLF
jgi:hypothetical protein